MNLYLAFISHKHSTFVQPVVAYELPQIDRYLSMLVDSFNEEEKGKENPISWSKDDFIIRFVDPIQFSSDYIHVPEFNYTSEEVLNNA